MKCKKCGMDIKENAKYCPFCGAAVDVRTNSSCVHNQHQQMYVSSVNNIPEYDHAGYYQQEEQGYQDCQKITYRYSDMPYTPAKQPTAAIVVELIGLLFICLTIFNIDDSYQSRKFLVETGYYLFCIGFIFVLISFFMFCSYKRKYILQGFGYVAYVISCVGAVLSIIFLIMVLIVFLLAMGITGFAFKAYFN